MKHRNGFRHELPGAAAAPGLAPIVRDPAPLLERLVEQVRERRAQGQPLWIFGYASLIWRPDFEVAEHRAALVRGWHRALRMRSRVNRGTPQQPGLVFALLPGGSCHGVAYRIDDRHAETELRRLWQREMPTGVYDARFLPCRTAAGRIDAVGFTLSRRSPNYTGALADDEMLHILRTASGRYGSTLEYLQRTAACLHERGVPDREIDRLMALARAHRLL